jgi:electron transfer flavoprotein beta subunit
VGSAATEPVIRKALAIGADDAIRVDAECADAYSTAVQIAEVVKKENFDIILCGIESSDFNGSVVGGMIAEFLEIPSISAVSDIRFDDGKPVLVREIDGGKENVSVPVPFVAVVQKGIAKEPRIAAMRGIMMARTKPIKLYQPDAVESLTQIVKYEKPLPRAACKLIDADDARQLVTLLQNEAKII